METKGGGKKTYRKREWLRKLESKLKENREEGSLKEQEGEKLKLQNQSHKLLDIGWMKNVIAIK